MVRPALLPGTGGCVTKRQRRGEILRTIIWILHVSMEGPKTKTVSFINVKNFHPFIPSFYLYIASVLLCLYVIGDKTVFTMSLF